MFTWVTIIPLHVQFPHEAVNPYKERDLLPTVVSLAWLAHRSCMTDAGWRGGWLQKGDRRMANVRAKTKRHSKAGVTVPKGHGAEDRK